MALDNFRRIAIDVDTANDYIPPVMLSGGDSNGRTLLVKLTDNGKAITSAADITAKLVYADGCGNSGYKTMASVSGYETAAWECAAPGSVLKTDSAHLCIQFWQGSDVVCTRVFHASVDRNLVSLESGTTSGDAVKELYDTIANLNQLIDRANTSANKANSSAASADANADAASKAASAANEAAQSATSAASLANDSANAANAASVSASAAAKSATSAISGVEAERQQLAEIRVESSNAVNKATKACSDATSALKKADDATNRLTSLEEQAASNESARASAEESRASAETARANAESARVESEGARSAAETSRAASEQARAKAEKARSDADAQRETRQLKNDSDQAQNNAAAKGPTYRVCSADEYRLDGIDGKHNVPAIDGKTGVMYLTPKVSGATDEDAYDQWMYIDSKWELMGESGAHIDPTTTDDIDSIVLDSQVTADRYLNSTGLTYFWAKAKEKFATMFAQKVHEHSASDITSGTLPVACGGTGSTDAVSARAALGAASDADLATLRDSVSQDKDWIALNQFIKYRKTGNIVTVAGASSGGFGFGNNDKYGIVGTLPPEYCPSIDINFVFHSTGATSYNKSAFIDKNGDIKLYDRGNYINYWGFCVSYPI